MRINQPDWKFADLLRIVQRFVTSMELSSDGDVHLPEVFSNKGYSGSKYTPSADRQHVHTDWPTAAEVRSEYAAAVARQLQAYLATHVKNPSTGQVIHKQAALVLAQNTASDTTPGAGRTRYIRKGGLGLCVLCPG